MSNRLFSFVSCWLAALSCNENDGESMDRDSQYSSSQKTKRMRTSFKHHQLRTMKSYFAINHNPDAKDLKQLAQKTGLTKRVLQVTTTATAPFSSTQGGTNDNKGAGILLISKCKCQIKEEKEAISRYCCLP